MQANSSNEAASNSLGAAARVGVIFDCDGVLLDSMGAWKNAELAVCATVGKTPTREDVDYVNTLTIGEAARFFHEEYGVGENADDVARMIDDSMIGYYREQAQPCAGALAFVRALHERGVRMVVVSSSPLRYLEAGLSSTGFSEFLEGIFSADKMQTSKRARLIFDAACERLGTDAACTWGFDDTAYALDTMATAGYKTVGIYSGNENSSMEQLRTAADRAFEHGFEELTVEQFLGFAECPEG